MAYSVQHMHTSTCAHPHPHNTDLTQRLSTCGLPSVLQFCWTPFGARFYRYSAKLTSMSIHCKLCVVAGAELECYAGVSPATEPLTITRAPLAGGQAALLCVSYAFRCTEDQAVCTQEEITKKDVFRWMYTRMSVPSCEQLKAVINSTESSKNYTNLMCCDNESLCNKPDPALDPCGAARILNQTSGGDIESMGLPCNRTSAAGVLAVPHMLVYWYAMLLAAAMGGVFVMG